MRSVDWKSSLFKIKQGMNKNLVTFFKETIMLQILTKIIFSIII